MCNRKFLSNSFTVWNSMACRRDAPNFAKNILVPSMHRSLSSHAWHYGSRLGYFRSLSSDWYWSHKCLDIDIFACQLDCDENPNKMKLTKVCLKVQASVVIDEFLTKMYFIFNSFLTQQARQARQRSGLDFQIHKSRGYPVIILEALLLTIGLAWRKSVPASLLLISGLDLFRF